MRIRADLPGRMGALQEIRYPEIHNDKMRTERKREMSEICISCGAEIPEGTQICKACAQKNMEEGFYIGCAVIDKLIYTGGGTLREVIDWAEKQMEKVANELKICREDGKE